jgi:hypothetical protein
MQESGLADATLAENAEDELFSWIIDRQPQIVNKGSDLRFSAHEL